MAEQVFYFAFGSNMLRQRLARRCPSARALRPVILENHAFTFSKIGRDGSGKATVVEQDASLVYGVLYTLDAREIDVLDTYEGRGKGYDRVEDCALLDLDGATRFSACTYRAPKAYRDAAALPFDWYHALVMAGARQNGLPEDYIAAIAGLECRPDPDPLRPTALEAKEILGCAGFPPEW